MIMRSGKINNIIRIPSPMGNAFFRAWLEFLHPFHGLANREMEIAASILKFRHELSKVITDEALLDEIVLNNDTKRKVRAECNVSVQHFEVAMNKFRKVHFIEDGKINPKFIPKGINENDQTFQLLLYFDLTK